MNLHLKTIIRFWTLLKPFHKRFYFQLILIFIFQAFVVINAYIASQILNSLVDRNITMLVILFALFLSVSFFDNIVDYFARKNAQYFLDQNVHQYLQEFSLKKLFSLTIEQHLEQHSQYKLNIISRGETAVYSIVDRIITSVLPTLILALLTIITVFLHSPLISLVSVTAMIVIFTWAYKFNKNNYTFIKKNRDNWNDQAKIRGEAFNHFNLVKILNRSEKFISKYLRERLEKLEYSIFVNMRSVRHIIKRNIVVDVLNIATFAMAVYFFIIGFYVLGTVYLIWNLTSRVYWQIASLSNVMREIPQAYADAERFFEIIDTKPSFNEEGKILENLKKNIVISNLSYGYPRGGLMALNNVTLTIPEGKITAFVGPSGSGKTTIIKLLMRIYNYKDGSIKIGDDELSEIDAGIIREKIGYVEQNIDLIDDTLRENILLGAKDENRHSSHEKLEHIAISSRISEFYHRLGEDKFETMVGERGIKLSGGERQRVGIARAIIKDPDILIFDEATSSLDTENEKYVMEAIKKVSAGKTTIIIAHRLSTVRDADKIIVMDKGFVISEGNHKELLTISPIYKNLVVHQLLS